MSEGGPQDPLAQLGERLKRARAEQDRESSADDRRWSQSALGLGFRIGIEVVAALLVGLALGWATDHFFGTRPWGLIAFFFIGAAAGMLNAYRAAQGMGRGSTPR